MTTLESFEALVERHLEEIFRYLWRLLYNEQDAEDCLQETFLRAYRAFPRFSPGGNARAWLYTIATNTARTYWKQNQKNNPLQEVPATTPHPAPGPEESVQWSVFLSEVLDAVNQLPGKQRSAIILRKYQECSYQEIGEILGCSETAARANVYQAVSKLRKRFPERTI
jgi:RNA polymerase sigma-70 factor (ECF subfamily)